MKHVGHLVELDAKSGIGTVRVQGSNHETTIFAADMKAAGIVEPKVGTRLIYSIGARPGSGVTCAIQIEPLHAAPVAPKPTA